MVCVLGEKIGYPIAQVMMQVSNFTSSLLKQVYSMLGIQGVKTSPYHPQIDDPQVDDEEVCE